jgi:hypothetical protein
MIAAAAVDDDDDDEDGILGLFSNSRRNFKSESELWGANILS